MYGPGQYGNKISSFPQPEFDTCSSCLFLVMLSRGRLISQVTCWFLINPPSHASISHSQHPPSFAPPRITLVFSWSGDLPKLSPLTSGGAPARAKIRNCTAAGWYRGKGKAWAGLDDAGQLNRLPWLKGVWHIILQSNVPPGKTSRFLFLQRNPWRESDWDELERTHLLPFYHSHATSQDRILHLHNIQEGGGRRLFVKNLRYRIV